MYSKIRILILSLVILIFFHAVNGANVTGYFANWQIYGDRPYTPADVPYEKLTHIQYAFFLPETNGDISFSDPYADSIILMGKMIWSPVEKRDTSTSLITLAHQNGVKVLASVGGWTGSSNFPALAASAASRSNFCSKAHDLISKFNFDGIDIDWEYPCYSAHNGTAADSTNFVLLLSELRDTLDAIAGEKKLITLAIASTPGEGNNYLIEKFHQDVDYISIMTYDYTGPWADYAWHSSPLYNYGNAENWSLDRSMKYYMTRGIPASKFNIGMAFYGKFFKGCTGPGMTFAKPAGDDIDLDFAMICDSISKGSFVKHRDDSAQVPYCLSTSGGYCTYDDTQSIALKSRYCVDNGYAGAIIWELSLGRLSDGSQPLLSAASEILKSPSGTLRRHTASVQNSGDFKVITNSSGIIVYALKQPLSMVSFTVYNLSGRIMLKDRYNAISCAEKICISQSNRLKAGRYLLKAKSANKSRIIPLYISGNL